MCDLVLWEAPQKALCILTHVLIELITIFDVMSSLFLTTVFSHDSDEKEKH